MPLIDLKRTPSEKTESESALCCDTEQDDYAWGLQNSISEGKSAAEVIFNNNNNNG